MSEKKLFVHPDNNGLVYRLYHRGDDMSCRWNINYNFEGKRHQVRGMNRGKTFAERYAKTLLILEDLYQQHRNHLPACEVRTQVKAWLETKGYTWRAKTIMAYDQVYREYFTHLNGRKPTEKNTRAYVESMQRRWAANTVYKRFAFLKTMLTQVGYGWTLHGMKVPKGKPTPYRYFQENQRYQLMEYMNHHDPTLMLFCRFIFYCFIRPKEIRFLKVGDIQWDTQDIRIPGTVAKNGDTETAVIPDVFLPELRKAYFTKRPNEFLFPGNIPGKPISYNVMSRRFRKVLDELGFGRDFAMYSWKHTGAIVAYYDGGVRIKELMILMRHKDLSYTDSYMAQLGVKNVSKFRSNMPLMEVMKLPTPKPRH